MATKKQKASNPDEVFTPTTAIEALNMNENRMMFRFGARDTFEASLSIVQPNSRMEEARENIGRIYNNLHKSFYDEVEVVIFAFETPREMWREKTKKESYNPNEKPICKSPNGVFPYKNFVDAEYKGETIPALCQDCVFLQTGECLQHYAYFMLQCDNLKKAAYRPTFKSFRQAKLLNAMLQEDAEKGEFWTYLLSTTDQDDEQWWTLRVERSRRIEDEGFIKHIIELNKQFETNRISMIDNRMNVINLLEGG